MDLLRRHLSLVIASVITLAGTILLSVFLWRASRELTVKKQKLLEIKINKEKVQKFQWELNSATQEACRDQSQDRRPQVRGTPAGDFRALSRGGV